MNDQNTKEANGNASEKYPEKVPLIPIADGILFPRMVIPIVIGQKEYVKMIDGVMAGNRMIGLVAAKTQERRERYRGEDLHDIGTLSLIL
jgi:ATP-dependent Lon protease